MNPAFSVIFFTTASGAGFGLFVWLGLLALTDQLPGRMPAGIALILGAVFATAGLLSSIGHLGQPTRAWRAFSQWRSSWLSREGVLAVACFLPALWLGWMIWRSNPHEVSVGSFIMPGPVVASASMRVAGAMLTLLALATIACTAMIYASLKPVPAWRHPLVVPIYLAFALFTGGLLWLAVTGSRAILFDGRADMVPAALVLAGALALTLLKVFAWRFVDEGRSPVSRNSALGLPHVRAVHVFERPHTEANYLLKEMGYVLARKHARKLRLAAVLLFAVAPALCMIPVMLSAWPLLGIAAPIALTFALAGALVERWLFFAEARHLVTLYY